MFVSTFEIGFFSTVYILTAPTTKDERGDLHLVTDFDCFIANLGKAFFDSWSNTDIDYNDGEEEACEWLLEPEQQMGDGDYPYGGNESNYY